MMKKIKTLDDFSINESVIGKYTTMSADEIDSVLSSRPEDLGASDNSKRAAIIKAIENAMSYFDPKQSLDLDVKALIVSAASDDEGRSRLHNLAKTFASSLNKIRAIEISEIEPVTSQVTDILGK
jgi:hypothetical protein